MVDMNPTSLFRALAEPIRLRIVVLLLAGEMCVCELTTTLRLPQSTVSRHMARLRAAGLVRSRRCGKWVYYCLASGRTDPLVDLVPYLEQLSRSQPFAGDRHRQKLAGGERCSVPATTPNHNRGN